MTGIFPHLSTVSLAPFFMWALSHWHLFLIQHCPRDTFPYVTSMQPRHFESRLSHFWIPYESLLSIKLDATDVVSPQHIWNWCFTHDWHLAMFKDCLTGTFCYVSTVSLTPFLNQLCPRGTFPYVTCMHAHNHAIFSPFWVPFESLLSPFWVPFVNKIWIDPTWLVGGNLDRPHLTSYPFVGFGPCMAQNQQCYRGLQCAKHGVQFHEKCKTKVFKHNEGGFLLNRGGNFD